ncbi:hypothetical protein MRX96_007970 [Rhipicephalus microplus]
MSEHCNSTQGLQANAVRRSGLLPEHISLSEPTCSQGTANNDYCTITDIFSTRSQPEWSEFGGMGAPQHSALATHQQLFAELYRSGSTGRTSTIGNTPPNEPVLEMSEVLCRRQHASTHAQENMSLASTEAVMAAPDDQPRLVPPAHPFNDTVRGSLSALRRQPVMDDDDVIVEVCKFSQGGRHFVDDGASGRSLCHCSRALSSASPARATARGPRAVTSGGANTTDNRAHRRAVLFDMNAMRALRVLDHCQDERARRVVLQLYKEGRNSLAKEAYAAEMHALVRSAVDRARLDGSAFAKFLQDLSNSEWLFPETPSHCGGGPQLRNMRDLS